MNGELPDISRTRENSERTTAGTFRMPEITEHELLASWSLLSHTLNACYADHPARDLVLRRQLQKLDTVLSIQVAKVNVCSSQEPEDLPMTMCEGKLQA